ncbi:unnamed protein product [Rangifer tarandus platyrhynchus]|uniref:Uncharacterized protein n=2 Tax=Rangifer tarandus platyrhynchus TaxID=3082113 RepID=A0ABN8ZB37_RANTA|nr:unnamed protein product [Rangifer tarandus platyrhynchus]
MVHETYLWGFPDSSVGKESTCNAGDPGLIPGLGRSPGEGTGYPLRYYGLLNSMDCINHGVTKNWTRVSDFHLPNRITTTYIKETVFIFGCAGSSLLLIGFLYLQ